MTLVIDKKLTEKELDEALKKMQKKNKKHSLKRFFGTAIEKIDGVEFQRKVRDDWN